MRPAEFVIIGIAAMATFAGILSIMALCITFFL